jgi:hypothetical protein
MCCGSLLLCDRKYDHELVNLIGLVGNVDTHRYVRSTLGNGHVLSQGTVLLPHTSRASHPYSWPLRPLQDFSLDARKELNIQAPAQNLIAMAMHGSRNFLGVWDVDEYLMLPGHQPIMHEVRPLPLCTSPAHNGAPVGQVQGPTVERARPAAHNHSTAAMVGRKCGFSA